MKQKLLIILLVLALLCSLSACVTEPPTTAGSNPPSFSQPGGSTTAPPLQSDCTHKDDDGNFLCDHCKGSVGVSLDFYAINDLHGRFDDTDAQPGLDELSTYLEYMDDDTTVLLASGDMWQGSAESNLTYGAMMTEWMNEMDFVSMTLGNHEFDWGESYIRENQSIAEFPFLAINVYDRSTNTLADYCQPSVMIERSGLQIGIIGAIGDCYDSISGDNTKNIYFQTGSALTELVKAESERLRSAGADIIVYSIHDGGNGNIGNLKYYYDLSLSDGYVDLVFEGHSHSRYNFKDAYGVHHIQGGAENDGISKAKLVYNLVTGDIQTQSSFVSNSVYETQADHPIIGTLMEKYADQIAQGNVVLGFNEKTRDSYYLRDILAWLYFIKGNERWGESYEITLGGGYFSIRNPYELAAGDVRYADLYSLFPFDNELVLCSVKGVDLIANFLETENANYFIHYDDPPQVDPDGTYYIIVDTYTSTYAPNKLTEIERYGKPVYSRDLLAEYISQGGFAGETIPDSYELTDIPTLLGICENLAPNSVSAEYYFVRGMVVSISNPTYGNMTIADENGNQLYIYGVNDRNGNRYDSMADAPQPGDVIILYGQMKNYVPDGQAPILEMVETKLIRKEIAYTLTDIPALLDICAALEPNSVSTESYYVQGTVISIDNTRYGNMTIVDENGNQLFIYGVNDMEGNRYESMTDAPQVGDTIVLCGQMKHYVPEGKDAIYEMIETVLIGKM